MEVRRIRHSKRFDEGPGWSKFNRGIPQGRRNRFLNRLLFERSRLLHVTNSFKFFGEVDPFWGVPQRMLVSGDE